MTVPPLVTVIIVNYNAGTRLAKCLAHLEAQTFRDFETIVFDNASSDGSAAFARADKIRVRLIEGERNLGFAAANNLAAADAKGEWLAFLNPDAYAAPDWLSALLEATTRYRWADAFGSTQIDAASPDKLDGAGDVYHVFGIPYRGHFGWPVDALPDDGECFSPCAAAALYRRKTFSALGGFDERFFCYGEDVDLGFRLRLAGGRAIQVKAARVFHEGSGVTGRYSDFTVYHGNRNRIWTFYKNMPALFLWTLAPFHFLANAYLLARSFSIGIGGAYWRALKDGYGGIPALRKSRREIQRKRTVSLGNLMRALTWSPRKVSQRAADLKPIARPRR